MNADDDVDKLFQVKRLLSRLMNTVAGGVLCLEAILQGGAIQTSTTSLEVLVLFAEECGVRDVLANADTFHKVCCGEGTSVGAARAEALSEGTERWWRGPRWVPPGRKHCLRALSGGGGPRWVPPGRKHCLRALSGGGGDLGGCRQGGSTV
ncbi:hypothetical protein CYMTET_13688 [Cymbomonas tetramitiformis]|uniref:Uncharacterized protein n=1 Tax=Cymbomonas tetramitiformis TaxID=36881 RepID=A0AAE0LB50_9CHLO|nr:hypothetical protein CYMTET_13688 [Cymbomonas tetramitiformis]